MALAQIQRTYRHIVCTCVETIGYVPVFIDTAFITVTANSICGKLLGESVVSCTELSKHLEVILKRIIFINVAVATTCYITAAINNKNNTQPQHKLHSISNSEMHLLPRTLLHAARRTLLLLAYVVAMRLANAYLQFRQLLCALINLLACLQCVKKQQQKVNKN